MRWNRTCVLVTSCLVAGLPETAAGQGRPPDSGPPVPPALTVEVDCAGGDSINAALARPAGELTVEIRGFCREDVVVRRDRVTLRGGDPAVDGIRGAGAGDLPGDGVVRVEHARGVRIENLTLTGGARHGLAMLDATAVEVAGCRLVDNARAGLVPTVSSSVFVTDTTISGNGRQGILAFDDSLVQCLRCTIQEPGSAVLAVRGPDVEIRDSTLAGGGIAVLADTGGTVVRLTDTAVTATGFALVAFELTEIHVSGGSLSGGITGEWKSLLVLDGVVQTANPVGNFLDLDSTARLTEQTSLQGDFAVLGASTLLLEKGSTMGGNLACGSASDAFCDDPTRVAGTTSGCASCVKPPPCVATTGREYVISGAADQAAGILVDDFLRVYVNGSLVAEVTCCAPASPIAPAGPIRFTASTGDTLRVVAQDGNTCYSLGALFLQKADRSCLTQLTAPIAGPDCGAEPFGQVFFDQSSTLP